MLCSAMAITAAGLSTILILLGRVGDSPLFDEELQSWARPYY